VLWFALHLVICLFTPWRIWQHLKRSGKIWIDYFTLPEMKAYSIFNLISEQMGESFKFM